MRNQARARRNSGSGDAASRRGAETTVQSVDRAVTILEALGAHGVLGVTALAEVLGVHKSTASRLVSALERRGLVEQEGERGGYRLGVGILALASATTARLDLAGEARPVARDLAARTQETVNLAVLAAGAALYLDQVTGSAQLTSYNWVGQHIPLHATSNGKVLLSELPADSLPDVLGELTAYTPRTVTDLGTLVDQLTRVRQLGYAVAVDELDIGLTAVAAPIRDSHGDIVASLSLSGPTFRIDDERIATLAGAVVEAGTAISRRLGWH